jgi:hypothetical protein
MKRSDRRQAKPDLFENTKSASDFTTSIEFSGTNNPRQLRAIHALLAHPLQREQLDRMSGCSNGPDLIAKLRDLGLGKDGLPCTMISSQDRDGQAIRYGVYSFSEAGRRAVNAWLHKRKGGED